MRVIAAAMAVTVFGAACGQGKSGPLATEQSADSSGPPTSSKGGSCPPSKADQETFKACSHSKDGVACREKGGEWKVFARQTGGPTSSCVCPVPDEGCPCTKSTDCSSACVVEHISSFECKSTGAVCGRTQLGCRCIINRDGKASALCID